jgi:hypothetical protein
MKPVNYKYDCKTGQYEVGVSLDRYIPIKLVTGEWAILNTKTKKVRSKLRFTCLEEAIAYAAEWELGASRIN